MNQPINIQLLGVIFDMIGAYYLSKGFMSKKLEEIMSETYGDPNPNSNIDLGFSGNLFISLLIQREEAKIGFWVLFLGFALQALGIIYSSATLSLFYTLLISLSAILITRFIHTKRTSLERVKSIHDRKIIPNLKLTKV